MVDEDRLDDLIGGGDDDNSGQSSSSTTNNTKTDNKESTKEDKLSAFKSSSGSQSSTSGGGTEDVKNLLFCLANMDAYTRVVTEYDFDKLNNSQTQIKEEFSRDVSGEITNFLGVFDIRDITNEYGYSWENILELAINNHDFKGDSLRTNSGNPTRDDIKDLLDCIANITLYVEGNYQNKNNMDNRGMRDQTVYTVAKNMYEQYKTIISEVGVQRIAESYGYDWEEDIVKGVLEEQDFESKLDG